MILQTIIQEEIDSSQELANYEEARTTETYSMRTYWTIHNLDYHSVILFYGYSKKLDVNKYKKL